jgi:dTDP-4-dehydrorhamnose 3,5-epimerase-like enzyme
MGEIIKLTTFRDHRGSLTVLEKILPFEIKRIFYIYGVDNSIRGGHRHKKTIQAVICISGSCIIENNNGISKSEVTLDSPEKCLILNPEDYHYMHSFSENSILLVLASENYDPSDYIFEDYD